MNSAVLPETSFASYCRCNIIIFSAMKEVFCPQYRQQGRQKFAQPRVPEVHQKLSSALDIWSKRSLSFCQHIESL